MTRQDCLTVPTEGAATPLPSEMGDLVVGLLFLWQSWRAFDQRRFELSHSTTGVGHWGFDSTVESGRADDPAAYTSEGFPWIPSVARWPHLETLRGCDSFVESVLAAPLLIEEHNPWMSGMSRLRPSNCRVGGEMLAGLMDSIRHSYESVSRNDPSFAQGFLDNLRLRAQIAQLEAQLAAVEDNMRRRFERPLDPS